MIAWHVRPRPARLETILIHHTDRCGTGSRVPFLPEPYTTQGHPCMLSSILLHLDGDDLMGVVVHHGVMLASRYAARLRGLRIMDTPRPSRLMESEVSAFVIPESERQERSRAVQAFAQVRLEQACVEAALDFDLHDARGNPVDLLVHESQFHDLVVTAQPLPPLRTRARAAFEARLREVCALARSGAGPLLVLRATEREIERVLLVYDGSPASARAIKTYLSQQLWPDAELRLLAIGPDAATADRNLHTMHGYIRRVRTGVEAGYLTGSMRRVLVPYVEKWSAELVVLGISPAKPFAERFRRASVPEVLRRTAAALYVST